MVGAWNDDSFWMHDRTTGNVFIIGAERIPSKIRWMVTKEDVPMLRGYFATAAAVFATCVSGIAITMTGDQRSDNVRITSGRVNDGTAVPSVGEPGAMAARMIAKSRTGSAKAPGMPSGPTGEDLALKAAFAPLPRPEDVLTFRPVPRPATPGEILEGAAIPPPPSSLRNASDLSCIAVAVYHEARDQEQLGQHAVASVILQRTATPHRWGDTACDNVIPMQFSFMTSRYDYPPIEDAVSWGRAMRVAARAVLNGPLPELRGADHYHATAVSPNWAPKMVRVRSIDDHVFYADPNSSL